MRGRSESTATGVSVPIEPIASTPVRAIGAMSEPQVLLRVAEQALLLHVRCVHAATSAELRRQVVEVDEPVVEPLLVRLLGRELVLDLVVGDDPALRRVDEEHPARLEPALLHDLRRSARRARRPRSP